MKVFRASRWQFALVLAIAVAMQPVAFALCQVNCLPASDRAANHDVSQPRRGIPCHDDNDRRPAESSGPETAYSLSAVHSCVHQSLPSLTRVVESVQRPIAPFLTVAATSFVAATHAQALSLRVTHAPPGQSAARTDVLRR